MSVIVDANVAVRVFLDDDDPEYGLVHETLLGSRRPPAVAVYGGRLTDEYAEITQLPRLIAALDRAGKVRHVPDDLVDAEQERATAAGLRRSDDPHVIALARAGRVRLLCTEDRALREDFCNPGLIAKPRGNVYAREYHDALLKKHPPKR